MIMFAGEDSFSTRNFEGWCICEILGVSWIMIMNWWSVSWMSMIDDDDMKNFAINLFATCQLF